MGMSGEKKPSLRLLLVIGDADTAQNVARLLLRNQVPLQYQCRGHGTASSEILSLCGLGETDKALTAASGVGPKLAQRIALELKDKMGGGLVEGVSLSDVSHAAAVPAAGASQAIAALVSLGYSQSEAALAVAKIDESLPVEEIIKLALRSMAGRR